MSLQGKVAIVTGGSRGIGAATAKLLASRGARVVVNYVNNEDAANRVVQAIKSAGGEALAIQADVVDDAQVRSLVEQAMAAFGRVDILVSNAGAKFAAKPLAQHTWDEFAAKVNGELKGAFTLTKAVMPVMIEQHYGRIIYVSSGLSRHAGGAVFISHGTAKAGLNAFAKYVAKELAPHGITANVVAPGLVETDATANQPPEAKQRAAAATPLGRVAQPEDIAGAIAFLASDDSGFMTGTYTPVNGGTAMD